MVVEPVGGATLGATVPPAGYLAGLRALCAEHGALLITDEVMCGLGRTGAPLAARHWGVTADIVAVGQGARRRLHADRGHPGRRAGAGGHRRRHRLIHGGHTYAGNPLSAATALAVLTVLRSEPVRATGRRAAARLRPRLDELAGRHACIVEVRGQGLLLGLELCGAGRPAARTAGAAAARARAWPPGC